MRETIGLVILTAGMAAYALGQPAAFPGAEGFGASATGGRGGRVIYVTNLNATGTGSLQWALDQDGPKYILFKVSGVINGDVQLTRGNVTIAGQTSPGGIIVRGFHTTEDPYIDQAVGRINDPDVRHAENWIMRHVRTRPAGGGLEDGLRLRYTKDAIVDHCSITDARDEAVEISFSTNVTIQNCILGETLGDHAQYGGMLMNYSNPADGFPLDRFSLHHNTWMRADGRMPEISRESPAAAGSCMDIELSNNLLWDPGYFIDVAGTTGVAGGSPVFYRMNWIGNYSYARPDFPFGMIWFPVNSPNSSTIHFTDNRMNLYSDRTDYALIYCCNDYPSITPDSTPPSYATSARHAFPSISYHGSTGLREYVYANAGAFPRDTMDRRLMEPVRIGTIDPTPRDQNPYGDALRHDWSSPPAPPQDSDDDGIPDTWETAHGLNPNTEDHNRTTLSPAGYTNLEVYLNELADEHVTGGGGGGGNDAPVADGGADRVVAASSWVILDGAASYDPDGDAITYSWTQVAGTPVAASEPSSPSPGFLAPPTDDSLAFRLTVSDGALAGSDEVVVTVGAGSGGPMISGISSRKRTPGGSATLNGTGFSSTIKSNTVWFGSARARIRSASPTRLKVRIPKSLPAGSTVEVVVEVGGQRSNLVSFRLS